MAFEGSPAVARHRLRLALRKAREARDLTQGQVADALDWSLSKLQRIEGGENSVSPTDTRALLQTLSVTDAATVDGLINEARTARRRSKWDDARYREHLTAPTKEMLQFESEARIIRTYQTTLVPGVLQIPELAKTVLAFWQPDLSEDDIAVRLDVRLQRRRNMFDRPDPPDYRLAIDQALLLRNVGGPQVFSDQLETLQDDVRSGRVDLRIVPYDHAAFAGMVNPFVIMTMGDDEDSILYRESHLVDELGQAPERVRRHFDIFTGLWEQSYSATESQHLLTARIEKLRTTSEGGRDRSSF